MNGNGRGKVLPRNLPGVRKKNTKYLSQDNLSPGRNMNQENPEYEEELLTTEY
jgi:hypothetical protein